MSRCVLALIAVTGVAGCRLGFDAVPAGGDAPDAAVPMTEVTVSITGTGAGTIVDPLHAVTCSASCTMDLPRGTVLHLQAAASAGSWFRGWTSGCGGRDGCDLTIGDQPSTVTADFTPEPNRIFLSSQVHDGNFGSLAAGDALCTSLANQAGLTGAYVILLSTSTTSFSTRMSVGHGWIRPDGAPVGGAFDEATGQTVRAAIRIDETGQDLGDVGFWAPSDVPGDDCNGWTSTTNTGRSIGSVRGANYQSGGGSVSCASGQHFLCAEIDRVEPVDPVPAIGRHAFTSVSTWADSAGLAAADATCTADAAAAGLPGTYLALLAPSGSSALARFDLTGPPWVRGDGMAYLPTADAWATATYLTTSLNLGPSNETFFYVALASGADTLTTVATDTTTCANWTGVGGTGCPLGTWDTSVGGTCHGGCGNTWHLLCLQQ